MHINQYNPVFFAHNIFNSYQRYSKNDVVDTCNRNVMSKDLKRLANSKDTPYQLGNGIIFPHTAAVNAETRLSFKQITF